MVAFVIEIHTTEMHPDIGNYQVYASTSYWSKQTASILPSSRSCSLRIYNERKKDVKNIVLFFKKDLLD